jgi:hypothetical protein
MAEIKSESVADFIPESVADLLRNQQYDRLYGSRRVALIKKNAPPEPSVSDQSRRPILVTRTALPAPFGSFADASRIGSDGWKCAIPDLPGL